MNFRVGHGVDVHAFEDGRPLIIGGVEIPHHRGLAGHSDADVLLHAVMDAFLGAAGKPDIGHLFPNTDSKWKGASSVNLLRESWRSVSAEGWQLENLDCSILAEEPKLSPFIPRMKETISAVLGVSVNQCGIKATTTEQLGFTGRKEGIMAFAVVLLSKPSS